MANECWRISANCSQKKLENTVGVPSVNTERWPLVFFLVAGAQGLHSRAESVSDAQHAAHSAPRGARARAPLTEINGSPDTLKP